MFLLLFQDELDDVSVKQGFTHRPQIQDEYSSAQNTSITPAKVCVTVCGVVVVCKLLVCDTWLWLHWNKFMRLCCDKFCDVYL